MIGFDATRALVRNMLINWERYEWTLQGFGMLRAYISRDVRLHVWSRPHQVERVTLLHDHPWDFESLIVSGRIVNRRWVPTSPGAENATRFKCSTIVCGPGGCKVPGEPESVWLKRGVIPESYGPGARYSQTREEIHETDFTDGTVTIIKRKFYPDTEHARVFYTDTWVSAEPRRAHAHEVAEITNVALERWTTFIDGNGR